MPTQSRSAPPQDHQRPRRAEAAPQTEERFRVSMESLLDPFVMLEAVRDADGEIVDFECLFANGPALEWNHGAQDEQLGRRLLRSARGRPQDGLFDACRRVIETGEPLAADGRWYEDASPDGTRRRFSLDIRATRIGDAIAYSWRDVTDREIRFDALKANEVRFRSAFDDAPIGMVMVSLEAGERGRYVRVNRAFCEMVGYSQQDLLSRGLSEITHPDDRASDEQMLSDLVAHGRLNREKRYIHRDGHVVWASLDGSALTDERGRQYALEHIVDITDRKSRERERKSAAERTERLAAFLTELNAAGLDFDRVVAAASHLVSAGYADMCNILMPGDDAARLESFGLRHRDPEAERGLAAVLSECPLGTDEGLAAEVLDSGRPVVVQDLSDELERIKLRPRLRVLLRRWPLAATAVMPLTVGTRIVGSLVLARSDPERPFAPGDVSLIAQMCDRLAVAIDTARSNQRRELAEASRRAALADLARTNKELDSLLDNIPSMVFVKDAEELRFVRLNRAGEELIGQPREALLGRSDYDLFPETQADSFTAKDRLVLAGGQVVDIPEEPIDTANGRRWLHTRKVPLLHDDGRPQYLLGIAEDITERREAAAALARSADRFRTTMAVLPEGLSVLEAVREESGAIKDFRWTYANAQACTLNGDPVGGLHGRSLLEILPDHVPGGIFDAFCALVERSGSVVEQTHWHHAAAESPRALDVRAARLEDGLVLVQRDVTELREAEAALQESERRFRELFEDAPIGMALVNPDGGFSRVNEALAVFTGFGRDELCRIGVRGVTHPDDLAPDLVEMAQLLSGETTSYQMEKRYVRPDGSGVWGLVSASALRDAEGRPHQVICQVQDITARKQSQELLTVLFEMLPDNLCIANPDGRFERLNPAWERTLGWTTEELQAVPFDHFIHPEDRERTRQVFRALLEGCTVTAFENRYRCRDGSYRWLAWNSVPVSELDVVVANARDVTEQKRQAAELERHRRELQRSNAELAQFAYVASHDLQTPLRSIRTFLELIEKDLAAQLRTSPEVAEHFQRVLSAAGRMQAMIRDLLVYSRAGRQTPEPTATDAAAVLADIVTDLSAAIADSTTTITHDPLPTVMVDQGQFKQLLQNLVENALKYRGDEPPNVHVSAQQGPEGEWEFAVRDNGIGLDPAHAERIFQIFQRLHPRTRYPGTGIGLAICDKIVRLHGGRIWVESQPGAGATFRFTLPQGDDDR